MPDVERERAKSPSLRLIALVALGGTVGTAVRALLEETFPAQPGHWPWATFGINVGGSFLLGLLVAVLAARGSDEGRRRLLRLGLGTGVLGGFTTYSTFIVEVDGLLRDGYLELGAVYAVGSVVLGIVAAALGIVLGAAPPPAIDPDEVGR